MVLMPFSRKPIYAYVLQIIVMTNHQSGKDTHVRGLRVLGPIEYVFSQEKSYPSNTSTGSRTLLTKTYLLSRPPHSKCTKQFDKPLSRRFVLLVVSLLSTSLGHVHIQNKQKKQQLSIQTRSIKDPINMQGVI